MCGPKALKYICCVGISVFLCGVICIIIGAIKLPTVLPSDYSGQDLQTYRYQSYGFYLIIVGSSVAGVGFLCMCYAVIVPCCGVVKHGTISRRVSSTVHASSRQASSRQASLGHASSGQAKTGSQEKKEDVHMPETVQESTIVRFADQHTVYIRPSAEADAAAEAVEEFEDYNGALFYKSTITLPFRFRHAAMINMNNQERITYIKRINSWLGATATQYYRIDFD